MNVKRIGMDLAKEVFQLHGVDRHEQVTVRKQLGAARCTRISRICRLA